MMNVNINLYEINKISSSIAMTINLIHETEKKLDNNYKNYADEWNDIKYRELGSIILECQKSLKKIKNEFKNVYDKLQIILKYIMEYENVNLSSNSTTRESININNNSHLNTNYIREDNFHNSLKNIKYNPIVRATTFRSEQEIINCIGGGDLTSGSCSSLALAYAGNRAGYIVHDFRGGQSRDVFSSRLTIEHIANIDGVNSIIRRGKDDTICAEQLMASMEPGREYYLATGSHAAIVRLNREGHYQYLELQSGISSENGWHPLTLRSLYERFGCEDGQAREYSNYLIDLDSLQSSHEFISLLGYINTDVSSQVSGVNGYVR